MRKPSRDRKRAFKVDHTRKVGQVGQQVGQRQSGVSVRFFAICPAWPASLARVGMGARARARARTEIQWSRWDRWDSRTGEGPEMLHVEQRGRA